MGAKLTKKNSFAKNCEQLIEESRLAHILKEEHHQIVQENVPYSCYEVLKLKNWSKCRYWNTSIFDRNRVILKTEDGGSDFINASYVDGHNAKGRFICTQAPLEETANDFWQMIFSHQVRVIVMLTRIMEKGREACYPYWNPKKRGKAVHGKFTIKTLKIKSFRYYAVTNLQVTDNTGASLDVQHFAYTDWPHNSLPRNPSKFLDFVLAVREAQLTADVDNKGKNIPPIVVHCSAGLNRTGAFCAIDVSLSLYNERATISLSSIVRNLRKQRHNCLSLPQYYVFCYLIVLIYAKLVADKY
ncbi:GSCOCT00014306001.2-RA-CDS [Cotesia congregata]|uniref:Cc_ptp.b_1.1 n=2 Tax=root TaxID=1 RepID=S6D9M1_COTCN|nr:PTPB [Bracoviriform congregatae]CAD6244235.1 GSCOCT00014306001.2-RA-CDS [Cotesia congregata]CAG17379.1 PTPB [Bracoviriform congregatae]CAG26724.1 protein tyrosine phosphatase [Bracoviriform congregatae]CAG5093998.1 cc_ptp.b_1.1 [Cotesia congregata]CCQ71314.1 protein tyrosine phosphatase PTPB [Cotesia congregata]